MVVAPVIGYTGDIVHSRYPNHGRQCLAQVCIVARCILMTVMLTCVPREAQSVLIFVLLAILIGFLAGWPGVGVNRPILTEIVNPEHRATTFALVRRGTFAPCEYRCTKSEALGQHEMLP